MLARQTRDLSNKELFNKALSNKGPRIKDRLIQDPNTGSLPTRVVNMASRFLARQSRSKTLAMRGDEPTVTFTFDDVPASACELGAQILERHGARGTFYVAGGGCGTASDDGPRRASIDQLRRIWADGHEIGCHTYSHPAVRYMSNDELGAELDHNRSVLKQIDSAIVVRNFAYPFGDMSIRTKRYLETRFDSCRSGHAGLNSGVADLGALNACPLQDARIGETKIADLMAEALRARAWLIFYSHDVAEQPTEFGVTPNLLDYAVGLAKLHGCRVMTVAESLKLVGKTNVP
jgi:peptidoglycan/xylan/chitin deacetylase (PgdA/CDA1 family)